MFLEHRNVIQLLRIYIYMFWVVHIHILFFRVFSIIGYYKIIAIVPYAIL